MPYRVTFVLGSFDGDRKSEARRILRHKTLYECLNALTRINLHEILAAKGRIPFLYESGVRYRAEPEGQEDWLDVLSALDAHKQEMKGGPKSTIDCFPKGTEILGENGLVAIEDVRVGDRIWGRDAWTTVEKTWTKGDLPVEDIWLNYGDQKHSTLFRLTADHKMYVVKCPKHSQACGCPADQCEVERVLVRELRPGDRVLSPARLPFDGKVFERKEILGARIGTHKFPENSWKLRLGENSAGLAPMTVQSVASSGEIVPCYDIQTSDHYVYLPEHDVTVSNCEDLACWRAAELQAQGIAAHPVFVWRKMQNDSHLYHIVVRWPDGRLEDPSKRLGMK